MINMSQDLSYTLPAEWALQEAVFLTWPHNPATWPNQIEFVKNAYIEILREILDHQKVILNVNDEQSKIEVLRRLCLACINVERLEMIINPTYDSWIRDYGPLTIKNNSGERLMTRWQFNGWGGKYGDDYKKDSLATVGLSKYLKSKICDVDFVLEGGSIEVNGKGLLITSTNCLLNENRNANYSKTEIELILKKHLGIKKVIWLSGEIKGDDTDGHIDDAVRLVADNTVVCIREQNKNDENYHAIESLYQDLCKESDQDGNPLKVVALPMPEPVYDEYQEGMRLPASYANFLITNNKVLVPVFNCKQDHEALQVLQEIFKTRKVVGIYARHLISGFGAVHCLSMQLPV